MCFGPRSLMTKGRFLIAAVNSEAVKALERLWSTDLGPWKRWRFLVGDFIQTIFQPSSMNSSPHWIPGNQDPIWMHFNNAEKKPCSVACVCCSFFFMLRTQKGFRCCTFAGSEPCWSAQDPRVICGQEFDCGLKRNERSVDLILLWKYVVAWLKLHQKNCIFECKF